MSDETKQPDAQDAAAPSGDAPKTFDEEYVGKLRDENAKWRTKFRDAEAKLAEKSAQPATPPDELKALRDKVEQMEAGIKQRDVTLLKHRIGAEHGLPAALIERLVGDDEDSIKADAAALKAALPAPATPATSRPSATAGMPSGAPVGKTREQLYEEIYGRKRTQSFAPSTADADTEGPRIFRRGG